MNEHSTISNDETDETETQRKKKRQRDDDVIAIENFNTAISDAKSGL